MTRMTFEGLKEIAKTLSSMNHGHAEIKVRANNGYYCLDYVNKNGTGIDHEIISGVSSAKQMAEIMWAMQNLLLYGKK